MIRFLIKVYILLLIVDSVLSFLPQYRNRPWALTIRKMANFTLDPVRKYMPKDTPFDFSPLVVIMLLNLLMVLW